MQKCIQYGLCLGILLFFAASLLSLGLSLSVQPTATAGESVSLPVLMYHSILDSKAKAGKYTIPPAVLEQDLQYLREHGYTSVSPEELIAYARGEGSLPEKPVLLTFDDGYYNNYSYVYPLLETYDMRAVISVVGSFTEQYSVPGAVMNNNYSHLNWAQLREMLDSGRVTLGNHRLLICIRKRRGSASLAGCRTRVSRTMCGKLQRISRTCSASCGKTFQAIPCRC